MKKRIFEVAIVIIMIIAICLPLRKMAMLFMNDKTPRQVDSLYSQPDNSIDVLCVGSSRVYCNIAPDVMWREYGISVYNLATSSQTLNLSYYAIKEALKNQNPKVVVVEVSMAIADNAVNDQLETMGLQTGMKYSVNQIRALLDHGDKDHFMEYLLRLPCFHNNYEELDKENFTKMDYREFPVSKGAGFKSYINDSYDYHPEMLPAGMGYTEDLLSEVRYKELEKIYGLCNESGIPLLLVLTPSSTYSELEAAVKFSQDYNVGYINYMNILDALDFTGEGDMMDEAHCNYYGAAKVSRYLAEYVINQYGVSDHRGDLAYYSWDEYANYLALCENNHYLARETGLGNYFKYIPNDNYIVITALKGDYDTKDVGQRSVLTKLGCNDAAYEAGGVWAMDGLNLLFYHTPTDGECNWHKDIGDTNFWITNEGYAEGDDRVDIYINGEKFSIKDADGNKVENGLQFIVYDKLSDEIVDAAIFDASNEYMIVRNKIDR